MTPLVRIGLFATLVGLFGAGAASAPAQSTTSAAPADDVTRIDDAPADVAPAGPVLAPRRRYVGIGRPAEIEIASPTDGASALELYLMTAGGGVVVGPTAVTPGVVDLNVTMPEIFDIKRACYLQLVADGAPVGSSIVVQPMLDRLPMTTEEDVRPDGRTTYTRVVGWGADPAAWGPEAEDDAAARRRDLDLAGLVNAGVRLYLDADAVLETTEGPLQIAFRPDEAPNTVWNFLSLTAGGFYDQTVFHRVVPVSRTGQPFVIQGGDPSGTGDGGPGYWLPLEPSRLPHDFGVISMARSDDPDSAGSQYFICLSREGTARLDGQYCSFGHVTAGAETILRIAATEIADPARGRPVNPPRVVRASLTPAPARTPGRGRPDTRVTRPGAEGDGEPRRPRVPR